jgi:NADH:ubiquinone reductase (H+-translocating)
MQSHGCEPRSASFDVVVLGASFAGLEFYYQLRRIRGGRELSVCVVDKQAEHGYIPLAHEELLGRLPLNHTRLRTAECVARDSNASYVVDEVVQIDLQSRCVRLRSGTAVSGRFLVVALGSQLAPPSTLLGKHLLTRYKFADEMALARARLASAFDRDCHVVVIGGGISGVELAGEFAHAARTRPLSQRPTISLIEAADRLLLDMHPTVSRRALRKLDAQGVQVHLGTEVLAVHPHNLQVRNSEGVPRELPHDLAFWAAGVRPNPLLATLGLAVTSRGYLSVNQHLQCQVAGMPARPDIFACGDAVRIVSAQGEWPTMQRAIECLWQAKTVARNIVIQSKSEAGARMRSHRLRSAFPYGVSIGARSLIVYRRVVVDLGAVAVWFRRFLMRAYFRRYCRYVLPEAQPSGDAILPRVLLGAGHRDQHSQSGPTQ